MATQPIVRPPARPAAPPARSAPAKQPEPAAAEAAPRASMTIFKPCPLQHENDAIAALQATGAPIPRGYIFAADGSPIDPQSYDPVQPTPPTWP